MRMLPRRRINVAAQFNFSATASERELTTDSEPLNAPRARGMCFASSCVQVTCMHKRQIKRSTVADVWVLAHDPHEVRRRVKFDVKTGTTALRCICAAPFLRFVRSGWLDGRRRRGALIAKPISSPARPPFESAVRIPRCSPDSRAPKDRASERSRRRIF